MISQLNVITANVNNKPFNLLLAPNSTYEELKEAMFQISKLIAQSEDASKEAAAEKAAAEASEPEEQPPPQAENV